MSCFSLNQCCVWCSGIPASSGCSIELAISRHTATASSGPSMSAYKYAPRYNSPWATQQGQIAGVKT